MNLMLRPIYSPPMQNTSIKPPFMVQRPLSQESQHNLSASKRNHQSPPVQRITFQSPPSFIQKSFLPQAINQSNLPENRTFLVQPNIDQRERSISEKKTVRFTHLPSEQTQRSRMPSQQSMEYNLTKRVPIIQAHKEQYKTGTALHPPTQVQVFEPVRRVSHHKIEMSRVSSDQNTSQQNIHITIENVHDPNAKILPPHIVVTQQNYRPSSNGHFVQVPHYIVPQNSIRPLSNASLKNNELFQSQQSRVPSSIEPVSYVKKQIKKEVNYQQQPFHNKLNEESIEFQFQKQPSRGRNSNELYIQNQKILTYSRKMIDEIFQKQTKQAILKLRLMESKSAQKIRRRKY